MAVSASASGLVPPSNSPITYSALAATKIAETTVVSKNARTLLRGRRPPAARLRCCDNAVLPWAERAGRAAERAGPLRLRQRVLQRFGPPTGPAITGQNRRNKEPTPLPHHVARSDGADQAFPKKKLGCCARNLCRPGHGLAISIVTITQRSRDSAVTTGSWRLPSADASRHAGTTLESWFGLAFQARRTTANGRDHEQRTSGTGGWPTSGDGAPDVGARHRRRRDRARRSAQCAVRDDRRPRGDLGDPGGERGRQLPPDVDVRHQAARPDQPALYPDGPVPALQLVPHRGQLGTAVRLRVPRRLPRARQVRLGHRHRGAHQRAGRMVLRGAALRRRRSQRSRVRLL